MNQHQPPPSDDQGAAGEPEVAPETSNSTGAHPPPGSPHSGQSPHTQPHSGPSQAGTSQTAQEGPTVPKPPPAESFFTSLRRSLPPRTPDRWIGGVCAGWAYRFGVDPLLIRGILVVLTFFGGIGLLLYGIGWALMPESSDGRIHLQEAMAGRVDAAIVGAGVAVSLGMITPGFWWGQWSIWPAVPLTAGLAALVLVVVWLSRRQPPQQQASGQPGHVDPGQQYQSPQATSPHVSSPLAGDLRAVGETHAPGPGFDHAAANAVTDGPGNQQAARTDPAVSANPWPQTGGHQAHVPGHPAPDPEYPAYATVRPDPVPGPGRTLPLVIFGLILLLTAWTVVAVAGSSHHVPITLGALGGATVLLGAGTLISGLRGRRGGVLTVSSILLGLVIALPVTLAGQGVMQSTNITWSQIGAPGDTSWRPGSTAELVEGPPVISAGRLQINLTEEVLAGVDEPLKWHLGAGEMLLIIEGSPLVDISAYTAIGSIEVESNQTWRQSSGLGMSDHLSTADIHPDYSGRSTPDGFVPVSISLRVDVGTLRIEAMDFDG